MRIFRTYIFVALSAILLAASGCSVPRAKKRGGYYDLDHPDMVITLPDTLREISGLTRIDDRTVGCIQDENGIVFIYDIGKRRIKEQIAFGPDGDYEGLACVENDMYVLRSDGRLFLIKNYGSAARSIASIDSRIPAENNEGLCYDEDHGRLLVASKVADSKNSKSFRMVRAFDIASGKTADEPVFSIDVRTLKRFARDKNLDLPYKVKKNTAEPVIRFKPSAIAIQPQTHQVFLLSAADHLLFILDPQGGLIDMFLLDKELFNKAEGIIFLSDGTLLISNEGEEGMPTILGFRL
jgi:uncharacterized protein YjiK